MSSVIVSNDDGSSSLSQDRTTSTTHAATSSSSLDSSCISSAPIVSSWEGVTADDSFLRQTIALDQRPPHSLPSPNMIQNAANCGNHLPLPNPLAYKNASVQYMDTSLSITHQSAQPLRGRHAHSQQQVSNSSTPYTVFYGPNDVVTVPDPLKTLFADHREHSAINTTVPDFMYQLTKLLTEDNREYIEWVDGVIKVHNPPKLASDVLHKYFRHSKYSSFQRQLNYFGFRKIAGKGKLAPCTYVNESVTTDLLSLLALKRISRASKPEPKDAVDSHYSTKSSSTHQSYEGHMIKNNLAYSDGKSGKLGQEIWNQDHTNIQKNRKRNKLSQMVSNNNDMSLNPSLSGTKDPMVVQSPLKKSRNSKSILTHGNGVTSHVYPVFTFLEPSQLGMDYKCGAVTDERDGFAAIKRDSSLVHLAMIPQVASMTDVGAIHSSPVVGDEDEEDLVGIDFMDF